MGALTYISALSTVLSLTAQVHSQLTPYLDGQCTQAVQGVTVDDQPVTPNDLANSHGFHDPLQPWTVLQHPTFPGAEVKDSSGYNVYWKIDQPGPGCTVVFMQEYSQQSYGDLNFTQPPGNTIGAARTKGCLYTNLQVGSLYS